MPAAAVCWPFFRVTLPWRAPRSPPEVADNPSQAVALATHTSGERLTLAVCVSVLSFFCVYFCACLPRPFLVLLPGWLLPLSSRKGAPVPPDPAHSAPAVLPAARPVFGGLLPPFLHSHSPPPRFCALCLASLLAPPVPCAPHQSFQLRLVPPQIGQPRQAMHESAGHASARWSFVFLFPLGILFFLYPVAPCPFCVLGYPPWLVRCRCFSDMLARQIRRDSALFRPGTVAKGRWAPTLGT